MADHLQIEIQGDCAIFLRSEGSGDFRRGVMPWREGFTLEDLHNAIQATGLVVRQNDRFLIDRRTSCSDLANYAEQLFAYFEAPGAPGDRLSEVIARIDAATGVAEDQRPSSWAYAWLDLTIRETAADQIRGQKDIWASGQVTVDLEAIRDARLIKWRQEQQIDRKQQAPSAPPKSQRRDSAG